MHARVLLIGADCPALAARHLREAAQALLGGADAVLVPAEDGGYVLPVVARTAVFGDVRGEVELELDGEGEEAKVRWEPHLVFPGMPEGATLERTTTLPPRAAILARDNLPLAEGPERTTTDHVDIADSIVGGLGPIPEDLVAEYRAAGYPDDAQVGISGLERIFERRADAGHFLSVIRRGHATRPRG